MVANILLAHPVFLNDDQAERDLSSPYFPLGLLYLAGYVRDRGHEVAVFDGTFSSGDDAFVQRLTEVNPDVVGVSALLPSRDRALGLAGLAAASGALVVIGGPDPTADPQAYLDAPPIDVVVHHEGEQTIARLLDMVDDGALTPTPRGPGRDLGALTDELGIAFRHQGRAVVNQPRPPIENLDELPLPARDLIDMDRYLRTWEDQNGYSSVTIATSRGCPFGCEWCRDAVHGDGFRQRSPESVAAEVAAISEAYDVDRLRFVDDVDGIDRSWFDEWAAESDRVGVAVPFEPLNESERADLPLLDVRDSL